MSFILDAIAKSEQERQQQQMPDASSLAFPSAAPARSRRTAPYLLAGLLLGSAILAAVWFQSPRPLVAPFAGPGGAAMPTTPAAKDRPQVPVESRETPPAAPADPPEPNSATRMLADSSATKTVSRTQPPKVEKKAVAPAAGSVTEVLTDPPGESSPVSVANVPANEISAEDPLQAGLETAPGVSGADAAAVGTPPSGTEAPLHRVSRVSELPADVRRALPSVVFTGHLYSRNPSSSYVFIDSGRRVVVGQQIVDGLVLDEITPTGVVVEFQGYLIEVGVLQNWSLN